jgi:hypothetical protein
MILNIFINGTEWEFSLINKSFMINNVTRYDLYDDEYDYEDFLNFRLKLTCLSVIFIVLGIFLNVTSVIVLNKNPTPTNKYLQGVCISSIISLIGFLSTYVIYNLFIYFKYINGIQFLMLLYPYTYPLITTAQISFVLFTVCVSLNQYVTMSSIKEIKRSKIREKKESQKAFKYTLIVYVFSVIYCSPYWFMFRYDKSNGLERTELNQNQYFKKIVHFCLYIPVAFLIPFAVLLYTNAYLIWKLKSSYQIKKELTSLQNRAAARKESNTVLIEMKPMIYGTTKKASVNETSLNYDLTNNELISSLVMNNNQPIKNLIDTQLSRLQKAKIKNLNISIMLIAMVTFFLICQSPSLALNMNEALKDNSLNMFNESEYVYGNEIAKVFLIINSSWNCTLFYLFSKRFRNDFKRAFRFNNNKN